MSALTWASSPAYGQSVALGPTQRIVLDVVLGMTRGGRRPELTLGRLAILTGRPVSSVHDALGRLRALGLIGVSARMGRHGGHRLWRVRAVAARALDAGAHRRTIARMISRWGAHSQAGLPGGVIRPTDPPRRAMRGGSGSQAGEPTWRQLAHGRGDSTTPRPSSQAGTNAAGTRVSRPLGSAAGTPSAPAADPDSERPWYEKPPQLVAPEGETVLAKLIRYGMRPDVLEREANE